LADTTIEARLQQLTEWGNLLATRDSSEVSLIEDFYRPRFLYQLSAEGEAAEAAIQFYYEQIDRPGELQVAALGDIIVSLQEIETLLASKQQDDAKLLSAFKNLAARFEELTSKAQTFMRSLQQTIDLYGVSVDDFLKYKEMLIGYLERFIGELVTATNQIAGRLRSFQPLLMEEAFDRLAARELIDMMNPSETMKKQTHSAWQRRWLGLCRWFLGETGKASQAEILRHRARSAIPEANDDAELHKLWRAAFALSPSRHYAINSETLEERDAHPVPAKTSWLDADPVWITPRLRQSGRSVAKGPAKSIIDKRREKEALKQMNAEQTRQIAETRTILATNQRLRLSEVARLNTHAFELFLDLLGEALARKYEADASVLAPSSDGSRTIHMEPIPDAPIVTIPTEDGELSGTDHWITIKDTFTESTGTNA
jgi:hypothetical protein